jgi:aspartyl/glutamyl-tRNA(Asn/Gln) amidotransferase C subunit
MEETKRFTSEMVDQYADRLLIGLSPEENKMVLDEFDVIDKNIDILTTIEGLENVEPMSWCLDRCADALREDVVEESIPIEDALRNSDDTTDREIEVPRVVG